ncbi:MAG: UDP-N-acetylglucosamine 1-carboxyvinyltransferase [Verrucomicrobia bacterium]|jgi:UDP-N-acetylglucosamine 1-carboxyvinyltransferase|nr:UDP-N-acetylglucosamine 1-carboxyvinyltransferase [Verrucomicrobiota bacterium]
MARFVIQGGKRISGKHKTPGNKNAALPMLAACVLTDQPVTLQNVPLIRDVHTMLDILSELGASVELRGHTVTICCAGLRKRRLDKTLCRSVRSSILFAGPMAARHGRVVVSPPGGDIIGRRRLDTHFDGLAQLGISVEADQDYAFRRDDFRAADILLDEASVTATENILMAAVLAPGCTTLFNAACEPHVQDLCRMLNKMGAQIQGIGTNYLTIEGVASLQGARHRVSSDYVEAASFITAAALTGGTLQVDSIVPEDFAIIGKHFARLGIQWELSGGALRVPAQQALNIQDDFGAAVPKIEDGTWPNFPSDLMSVSIVLASQAHGTMLFFEKMFESRMYFVDRLIEMGARIVQCDPHRVVVSGPTTLHGTRLSSPDIRAGMSMLLAALCAKGESIIENAQVIDRGYEHVDRELRRLGADIERID